MTGLISKIEDIVDSLPEQIVKYPDPRLRQKCLPVDIFDEHLSDLVKHMLKMMHAEHGVGLAGPQAGIHYRIFVYNPTGEPPDDRVLINPELVDLVGAQEGEEGCLSVPDVRVNIRRARKCRIRGMDPSGKPIELTGEDLLARIWQHEMDHLDGRLIVDRMSGTDRIANKKSLAELEAKYRKATRKR